MTFKNWRGQISTIIGLALLGGTVAGAIVWFETQSIPDALAAFGTVAGAVAAAMNESASVQKDFGQLGADLAAVLLAKNLAAAPGLLADVLRLVQDAQDSEKTTTVTVTSGTPVAAATGGGASISVTTVGETPNA